MVLTITPPAEDRFHIKPSYDTFRYGPSSIPKSIFRFDGPVETNLNYHNRTTMSTPHRGLPLPGPMSMSSDPRTVSQPLPPQQSHGYAPVPSQQPHAGQDERAAQDWYFVSKTEEDKRRQQEETTRQEELRLEQRRIERDMLRQSIEAGVPPHLLPLIFAAIGGAIGSNAALDMVQQYIAHLPPAPQHLQPPTVQATSHISPELRRETRIINSSQNSFPTPTQSSQMSHQVGPGQPLPPHVASATVAYPSPAYQSPANRAQDPNGYSNAAQAPKASSISGLPRLTTNEAQIHQPPSAPSYLTNPQDRASPSPSIYFHHWQPPPSSSQGPQSASKDPTKTSPNQVLQASSDTNDSPRKRKAQGPHQPAPVPSTAPRLPTSPSFSEKSAVTSRRGGGHFRQTSDQQGRGYDPIGRGHRQRSRRNSSQDGRRSRKGTPSDRRRSVDAQPPRAESTKSEG